MTTYISRLPFTVAAPDNARLPLLRYRTEQCPNGGFETGITGWAGTGGATITRDTAYARTGSASLKIAHVTSAGSAAAYPSGSFIAAPSDLTPLISLYATGTAGFSCRLIAFGYDSSGVALGNVQVSVTLTGLGNWVPLTLAQKLPAGTTKYAININKSGESAASTDPVWIDDVSILHAS